MEDFFHLNRQMNKVSLAIVHVVVKEPQPLRRIEKCKIGHFQREQLLIFTRIHGRIRHQRPPALPTGLGYLVDTKLAITWRGGSRLRADSD